MLEEDVAEALLDAALGDDALHVGGDVGGAAAAGAVLEGLLVDHGAILILGRYTVVGL